MFIAIVTEGYESSKKIERISFMEHVRAFDDKNMLIVRSTLVLFYVSAVSLS